MMYVESHPFFVCVIASEDMLWDKIESIAMGGRIRRGRGCSSGNFLMLNGWKLIWVESKLMTSELSLGRLRIVIANIRCDDQQPKSKLDRLSPDPHSAASRSTDPPRTQPSGE